MESKSNSGEAFSHGVASGDPRADRVIIWTRVTPAEDGPIAVSWQVSLDTDFRTVVAEHQQLASADADYTVKVDVRELAAGTRYYYRFGALGQRSPIGRTKTLPGPGTARVRFAQVTCAKLNVGYFNAYGRIADRDDLDFFLHLGDYVYETAERLSARRLSATDPSRAYDPLNECKTLDDYRRRYARYRLDPDLQRLHRSLPIIATLDDHEIADGAWREGAEDHEPTGDGGWAERRRVALQARWEWLPLRMPNPGDAEEIYQTAALGDLADLILVDTRTRRDAPLAGPEVFASERTALGLRQREWLLGELDNSRSHWRLIASPTLMADLRNDALPANCKMALRKLQLVNPHTDGPDADPWGGYPHERDLILKHLGDRGLGNVVVLSGDVHLSLASELRNPGCDGTVVAVEFVTPSITSQNLDDKMGWAPRTESCAIESALTAALPGLRWCELDSHGYVIVDVTRKRVVGEWWFVESIHRVAAGESCGARWELLSGASSLAGGALLCGGPPIRD